METPTAPSGVDLPKEMVELMIRSFNDGMKLAAHMLWDILTSFLSEHWLAILVVLFVFFVAVTFKAMMSRWGSLGSFLYNLLYFGTLLVVGLIWGPEVFINDYFSAATTVILYPICYFLVGLVIDRFFR